MLRCLKGRSQNGLAGRQSEDLKLAECSVILSTTKQAVFKIPNIVVTRFSFVFYLRNDEYVSIIF
jgi:hypothetical protein